jgi:GntR family transcriptional regulator/MocR family aminotransferase
MSKPVPQNPLSELRLEHGGAVPLNRQIYAAFSGAILGGHLRAGSRLPSTRRLSAALGVARNTVISAYELLLAEGYVECAIGAGTRVANISASLQRKRLQPHLSRRGASIAEATFNEQSIEARSGIGNPALDHFPLQAWRRCITKAASSRGHLGYAEPAGYEPLRALIAEHLGRTRGMAVSAEDVVVVSGAQQAYDLAARLFLDAGERVLFEDPGYPGARAAFLAADASLVPVPVDAEGMVLGRGIASENARAAYVTPAHQFPVGVTMSLSRRLALLAWAESCNAWIFEDDYDGEFRYAGEPLSALASLDRNGRVIYIGTFSKVMFPALRIGFMVMRPELAARVASARAFVDRSSPVLEQAALATFMERGHFARHVRRMRALYGERRAAIIEAFGRYGEGLVDVDAPDTGMSVVLRVRDRLDDVPLADALNGVSSLIVLSLSKYARKSPKQAGLIVGFNRTPTAEIAEAAQAVMKAFARYTRSRREVREGAA